MENLSVSLLCFFGSYFIVTLIGMLHTIYNIYVLHLKPMDELSMGEAYEATKPWHPIYNLVCFPFFGVLYIKTLELPTLNEAMITGFIWTIICIVIDLIGWVLIKHKWSLSMKEFYVDYQPWITFVYIVIAISPILAFCLDYFIF